MKTNESDGFFYQVMKDEVVDAGWIESPSTLAIIGAF